MYDKLLAHVPSLFDWTWKEQKISPSRFDDLQITSVHYLCGVNRTQEWRNRKIGSSIDLPYSVERRKGQKTRIFRSVFSHFQKHSSILRIFVIWMPKRRRSKLCFHMYRNNYVKTIFIQNPAWVQSHFVSFTVRSLHGAHRMLRPKLPLSTYTSDLFSFE